MINVLTMFRKYGAVSWKTTVAGIAALVAAWATALEYQFDDLPNTQPDWALAVTATFIFFGLLSSRDADKSSEGKKV